MRYIANIILISLFSISLHAYEGLPLQQVEKFFKDISSEKVNEAVDSLYSNNPSIKNKTQAITMIKQQLLSINALFGKNIGNENIHNEQLSASITRIVQVSKYELHPIIWEFYFYKPQNKWIVSDARFNDRFQSLDSKKSFEK
jgi:hypothetical protein